jgi:hypothetical protein
VHGEKIDRPDAGAAVAGQLVLPPSLPQLGRDELDAATHKNWRARRLHARLQARDAADRPLSTREVDAAVKACKKPDGKTDGEQALVLAAHAQRQPCLFAGGHNSLIRLLLKIAWPSLVTELRAFMIRIREQEAENRKRQESRHAVEQDRLERATRTSTLLKADRVAAADEAELRKREAQPVDATLASDQRLRQTLERMKRR